MKEGWERTEQPLELSLEELNQIAAPAFHGREIISSRRIGVGLSNSNYKIQVEGDGRPYVLRFFRRGKDIAGKEVALTFGNGYRSPNLCMPIRAAAGIRNLGRCWNGSRGSC
ncbi:hypothetical protein [Paenibacillus sp. Y412MC10]|uniref:hypothetical protein n=1 Tax=Geobacillus sp. (strain Y412MC10) TaxID=481743 RepID=UPI0021B23328|nr:hypothetical protein [Paenibacillus sp. Y412MC10]